MLSKTTEDSRTDWCGHSTGMHLERMMEYMTFKMASIDLGSRTMSCCICSFGKLTLCFSDWQVQA
jgi:hypothetical protein